MSPIVRPVAFNTSVPPENDVSPQLKFVPVQAPDNTSITASKLADPITVIW